MSKIIGILFIAALTVLIVIGFVFGFWALGAWSLMVFWGWVVPALIPEFTIMASLPATLSYQTAFNLTVFITAIAGVWRLFVKSPSYIEDVSVKLKKDK